MHDTQRLGNQRHQPDCGLNPTCSRIGGMSDPVIRAASFPDEFESIVVVLNVVCPLHPRSVKELQHDWFHLEPDLKPHFAVAELAGRVSARWRSRLARRAISLLAAQEPKRW